MFTPKDALLVVDMQYDFLPGGALAVRDADQILPPVRGLVGEFTESGLTIVFVRDWHPDDHCSFSPTPNFKDTWPKHCVHDTPGARLAIVRPEGAIIVSKGFRQQEEAYSGFDGLVSAPGSDPYKASNLEGLLHERGIEQVWIVGLATDYCVKFTALDAIKYGFRTVVVTNACRGLSLETSVAALGEMEKAGAALFEVTP